MLKKEPSIPLTDSISKVSQIRRSIRLLVLKSCRAAEALKVRILSPPDNNFFITKFAYSLQDGDPLHKPDGMGRLSRVVIEMSKLLLDELPWENMDPTIKGVFTVELLEESDLNISRELQKLLNAYLKRPPCSIKEHILLAYLYFAASSIFLR